MNYFSNKNKYLIFGTGITGMGAVFFCEKHNLNYFISDDDFEKLKNTKTNTEKKIYQYDKKTIENLNIDFLILSPSIHTQQNPHKIVLIAKELKIKIISDVDLFYSYLEFYNKKNKTKKQLIGITGTNGKSTTTSLIAFLLNKNNLKSISCGNIGVSCLIVDVDKFDFFVIEMSSYNLTITHKKTKFFVGILTNITEDHLLYHGTIKKYVLAKQKMLKYSKINIICIDDRYTNNIYNNICVKNVDCVEISTKNILKTGFSWKNNNFYFCGKKVYNFVFKNLLGQHNVENMLCSVGCVYKILEKLQKIKQTKQQQIKNICKLFDFIKDFVGLKHRIQFVREINNIEFYNDSKATNANSTQKALECFVDKNVVLIAGGQRKTAGFLSLKKYIKNVCCVFLIGEAEESFSKELEIMKIKYYRCEFLNIAVKKAFEFANNQEKSDKNFVVLFSPLCASWDQYKNFEERGDDFISNVMSLGG